MTISPFLAWCSANPQAAILLVGVVVSFINGLLPARFAKSRVGRVADVLLDRSAALARSNAKGTLKWPFMASVLLAPIPEEPPPSERPTTLPPPPMEGLKSVLVLFFSLSVVLPFGGTLFMGCPTAADLSMRASPGVPDPNGCEPGTGICIQNFRDSGLALPTRCSGSRRQWPDLPLDGLGRQRTCARGEGCTVTDAGRAICTPVPQEGSR